MILFIRFSGNSFASSVSKSHARDLLEKWVSKWKVKKRAAQQQDKVYMKRANNVNWTGKKLLHSSQHTLVFSIIKLKFSSLFTSNYLLEPTQLGRNDVNTTAAPSGNVTEARSRRMEDGKVVISNIFVPFQKIATLLKSSGKIRSSLCIKCNFILHLIHSVVQKQAIFFGNLRHRSSVKCLVKEHYESVKRDIAKLHAKQLPLPPLTLFSIELTS